MSTSSLEYRRSDGVGDWAIISSHPAVILSRLFADDVIGTHFVPSVDDERVVRQPRQSVVIGWRPFFKQLLHFRVIDREEDGLLQDVESLTPDVIHIGKLLRLAPISKYSAE